MTLDLQDICSHLKWQWIKLDQCGMVKRNLFDHPRQKRFSWSPLIPLKNKQFQKEAYNSHLHIAASFPPEYRYSQSDEIQRQLMDFLWPRKQTILPVETGLNWIKWARNYETNLISHPEKQLSSGLEGFLLQSKGQGSCRILLIRADHF